MPSPGRNDPCPCGSGKKFKRCCGSAGPVPGVTRDDRNAAMVSLLSEADFSAGRLGSVVWLDRSSGEEVCLATIEVSQGTLALRAFTPARAHRARARIEQVLGPLTILHGAPIRDGVAQAPRVKDRQRSPEPRAPVLPFDRLRRD